MVGGGAVAWYFTPSLCENVEVRRLPSPDGRLDLVVFERNCGATTDFSSQVSLVPHGASVDDRPGNVYIYGHRVPLALTWHSAAAIAVHYPPGFRGLTEARSVRGVSVEFAEDTAVKEP